MVGPLCGALAAAVKTGSLHWMETCHHTQEDSGLQTKPNSPQQHAHAKGGCLSPCLNVHNVQHCDGIWVLKISKASGPSSQCGCRETFITLPRSAWLGALQISGDWQQK